MLQIIFFTNENNCLITHENSFSHFRKKKFLQILSFVVIKQYKVYYLKVKDYKINADNLFVTW